MLFTLLTWDVRNKSWILNISNQSRKTLSTDYSMCSKMEMHHYTNNLIKLKYKVYIIFQA